MVSLFQFDIGVDSMFFFSMKSWAGGRILAFVVKRGRMDKSAREGARARMALEGVVGCCCLVSFCCYHRGAAFEVVCLQSCFFFTMS